MVHVCCPSLMRRDSYLDLDAEPEGDDVLFVDLAPDVEHREDEGGAEHWLAHEQPHQLHTHTHTVKDHACSV